MRQFQSDLTDSSTYFHPKRNALEKYNSEGSPGRYFARCPDAILCPVRGFVTV